MKEIWHKDCLLLLQYKRKWYRYGWERVGERRRYLGASGDGGFKKPHSFFYISASQSTDLKPFFFFFKKLVTRLWWKESDQPRQIMLIAKSPITKTESFMSLLRFYINSKVSKLSNSSQPYQDPNLKNQVRGKGTAGQRMLWRKKGWGRIWVDIGNIHLVGYSCVIVIMRLWHQWDYNRWDKELEFLSRR